jgi:phage/plasmid primase-like uncharacterized protein
MQDQGFVMTDREMAEDAAERAVRTRAMLAEADYTRYLEAQAEQTAAEVETIGCDACGGKGRIVTEDFDGRTGRECPDCRGTGELVLTPEEAAIVERFVLACRVAGSAVPAPVPLYPALAA